MIDADKPVDLDKRIEVVEYGEACPAKVKGKQMAFMQNGQTWRFAENEQGEIYIFSTKTGKVYLDHQDTARVRNVAEPKPKNRVPLAASDFPPGAITTVRQKFWSEQSFVYVVGRNETGVSVDGKFVTYQDLEKYWLRLIDGKWLPCEKEVEE